MKKTAEQAEIERLQKQIEKLKEQNNALKKDKKSLKGKLATANGKCQKYRSERDKLVNVNKKKDPVNEEAWEALEYLINRLTGTNI